MYVHIYTCIHVQSIMRHACCIHWPCPLCRALHICTLTHTHAHNALHIKFTHTHTYIPIYVCTLGAFKNQHWFYHWLVCSVCMYVCMYALHFIFISHHTRSRHCRCSCWYLKCKCALVTSTAPAYNVRHCLPIDPRLIVSIYVCVRPLLCARHVLHWTDILLQLMMMME